MNTNIIIKKLEQLNPPDSNTTIINISNVPLYINTHLKGYTPSSSLIVPAKFEKYKIDSIILKNNRIYFIIIDFINKILINDKFKTVEKYRLYDSTADIIKQI